MSFVERAARIVALRESECIERELAVKGMPEIVSVPYPGAPQIVYRIPGWREAPIRRLRIEWYRWRRRRILKVGP